MRILRLIKGVKTYLCVCIYMYRIYIYKIVLQRYIIAQKYLKNILILISWILHFL